MSEYAEFARSLRQSYEDNGFALIKQLLEPEVAQRVRADVAALFDSEPRYAGDIYGNSGLGDIRIDVFNRYPTVWKAIFDSQIIAVLKILLGDDFVFLPESALHRNGYGTWHKDIDAQQKAGHRFQWEADCDIVQIAFYLQANTPQYGGGLEVIPGSQRVDMRWYEDSQKGYRVDSAAGDMVIFNTRLDHKACWPLQTPPKGQEKYAVFFMASRNNGHARSYIDFIKGRPGYFFMDGFSYPAALQNLARQAGVVTLV